MTDAASQLIRTARAEDAAAIAAIWNHYICDTMVTVATAAYSASRMAELMATRQAAGRGFLVAEAQGQILGFATYDQFRASSGYSQTMEHSLYLRPGSAGQGLGRRLLLALETHAKDAGQRVMIACITGGNDPARAFHQRLGYAPCGQIMQGAHKFGHVVDIYLMQKILS